MPNECAVAIQLHGGVESGLAAHRGENRVRFFALEDRFDHRRSDRLDIGAIRELGIGHDRGGIRVHEHDLVAFLAQRFARLHARIIKFAALPDDDRAGADKEDLVQLVVSRHAQRETMQKRADWKSVILTDSASRLPACPGEPTAREPVGEPGLKPDLLCHCRARCRSR